MVWETEDSKNLYVQPMDMNEVGEGWRDRRAGWRGDRRRKIGKTVIA